MQHLKCGVMLVETNIITDDYITLVSWASDASKRLYKYETFQYMEQHQVLYIFSGLGTADENQRNRAASILRGSRGELRYRIHMVIANDAEFCIDDGLIM